MAAKSKNVSVRLDEAIVALIDGQAEAKSQDRSDFLRQLITRALSDAGNEEVLHELTKLREQLKRSRDDLAKLAVLILTRHPDKKPLGINEARDVVSRVLS